MGNMILIREFVFQFNMRRELLNFCVNVKEFWEVSVTSEKSQYYYVNAFCLHGFNKLVSDLSHIFLPNGRKKFCENTANSK